MTKSKQQHESLSGLYVEVKYPPNPSEDQRMKSFTNAWRKFKKMVQNDGVLQEYKDRQTYEQPSVVRRKARAMARKRWLKKQEDLIVERGW